ncbi:hypothetical protein ACER0C_002698 [Sarotherodon galilaeus]
MDKEKGLLNGKFNFKAMPDGSLDKTKVICIYCRCELSFHRSTSCLKYHLLPKHIANAGSPPPSRQKQTMLDSFQRRRLDNSTTNKLSTAIAKWVATAWRPINIVEDEGLLEIIRIASNDCTYELPSRATTATKIHNLYEDEKAKVEEAVGQTNTAALTGDYWTIGLLSNHSYLGVTAHYFSPEWELHSHALTVMKMEERHFADTCAEHFMQVARQWGIEHKVSTLTTDSARNMVAAARQLPTFNSALAKCRKVIGHFKHSLPNALELEQQQIAHFHKKESLTRDISTRWNSTLEMIEHVLRNQEPLTGALALHTTNVTMPTTAELEKLKKLETVLEHCRYITELLGGEKFVSCSVVLPDDPAYMVKFKETLKAEMESARKKLTSCDSGLQQHSILGVALDRCIAEQPATYEPSKKRSALMLASESSSDEEDCIEKCVERSRPEPTTDIEDCPQKWWSKHEGAHSEMAYLARKYLAAPATSIPCERLFSLSEHVVQKKRAALSSENVKMLVCLSNWFSAKKQK